MKRILVIRLSALGDVAMTIPAIYTVAQNYPNWEIMVLTKPFYIRMFINCPKNINFIKFEHGHHKFLGLIGLILQLHKMHFDYVADLHNVLRSWIITLSFNVTGTKTCMIQKNRKERYQLLKGNVAQRRFMTRPFINRYSNVFERLGLTSQPIISELPKNGLNQLPFIHIEKGNEKWVGIAPFARYENKTYPIEKMKTVVNSLSIIDHVHVFLFGGKEDHETLLSWERHNVKCLAGQMSLEEELSFMSRLDVMVSMDSANQHLASLVGTPVISIWGSTTPHCGFIGWKQGMDNALWADIPCQPCTIAGANRCKNGDFKCMNSLHPEIIINCIKKIIYAQ